MRLLLIRHGQTHSNVTRALDTEAPGADLTDLGRQQAEALPERLAHERIESIWVSHLVRTHQTAQPLATKLGLEVNVREGLREIRAGEVEMANDPNSVRAYIDTIVAWWQDPNVRMPGGETGAEVMDRFDAVVDEITATGHGTAVIVAHGAMISAWSANRTTVPREFMGRSIANTGIVTLDGDQSGWHLERWDESPNGGPVVDFGPRT